VFVAEEWQKWYFQLFLKHLRHEVLFSMDGIVSSLNQGTSFPQNPVNTVLKRRSLLCFYDLLQNNRFLGWLFIINRLIVTQRFNPRHMRLDQRRCISWKPHWFATGKVRWEGIGGGGRPAVVCVRWSGTRMRSSSVAPGREAGHRGLECSQPTKWYDCNGNLL